MDHKTEFESGMLTFLDKYDEKSLTFLAHFRGDRSHLKFVFPEDINHNNEETCLSMFSVLAKLSHDADVPVLFLIPSHYRMVCGVWYGDQLLIIVNASVEGEVVGAYKRIFRKLFSGSVGLPLKNLYIACASPIRESSMLWNGAVSIDLIEKLEEIYLQIPKKFQDWSKLANGYEKNDFEDFYYYGLPIGEVFENDTALYLSRPGHVINYRTIREILEKQKLSVLNLLRERDLPEMKIRRDANFLNTRLLPAPEPSRVDFLKDYYYRAFWQIVVHRLLIDQIQREVSSRESARPFLLPPDYNPIPMSDIAYAQLLKLIRGTSKMGSAEIDHLHAEVLQVENMDYSSYDPSGSWMNRGFSSDDDGPDSWFHHDASVGEGELQKKLAPPKLSVELAISYRFIGRNHWSDISDRRGVNDLLCGHNCCDCSELGVIGDGHDISPRVESPATNQGKIEKSASSPKPGVISSSVQFFVPHSTRLEDKAVELTILENEIKVLLAESTLMASKLLLAARSLEKIDGIAYSNHRCIEYLNTYKWIFSLVENKDCVEDILSCTMSQLDKDLAYCQLILEENGALIYKNNLMCEKFTKQKLLLESKDKITDASLKSTFPAHDINTLKKIFKDKELLSYFSTGVTELLISHINIEQSYQAIIKFFTELQKFITLIKMIQSVFKLRLDGNPAPADRIFF